jgi:hypothetical protein
VHRAALPPGAIDHIVIVVELENENFSATFGPNSPATYLNGTLLKQGELIQKYYATGHASLDNYISHVRRTSSRSGQQLRRTEHDRRAPVDSTAPTSSSRTGCRC